MEASRRYGLATESVAHLWLAGGHALAGDDAAMEASLADALARDPDDPRILGDLHGRVLVTRAFVADDLESLADPPRLDDGARRPGAARRPRSSPDGGSGRPCTRRDDDDLGVAALADCQAWAAALGHAHHDDGGARRSRRWCGVGGRPRRAAELVEQVRLTRDAIAIGGGSGTRQQVLVSMAAIRDGWGDPVTWLRESEAFFASGGYERAARRCRTLIGEAGAPVPRRRSAPRSSRPRCGLSA